MKDIAALHRRPYLWNMALLTAAAWEARYRLGVGNPTPVPTEHDIELLQWHAWA